MDNVAAGPLDLNEDEGVAGDDDDAGNEEPGPGDEEPVRARPRLRCLVEEVTLVTRVAPAVLPVQLQSEDCTVTGQHYLFYTTLARLLNDIYVRTPLKGTEH